MAKVPGYKAQTLTGFALHWLQLHRGDYSGAADFAYRVCGAACRGGGVTKAAIINLAKQAESVRENANLMPGSSQLRDALGNIPEPNTTVAVRVVVHDQIRDKWYSHVVNATWSDTKEAVLQAAIDYLQQHGSSAGMYQFDEPEISGGMLFPPPNVQ